MEELYLKLKDTEWPYEYTDHDRQIVRAVVYDDDFFYFVRFDRDDEFGNLCSIETSGGGVEDNEDHPDAIKRELKEELGAEVEVICKIGTVSDYYNLIHRHNINNYYLCKAISFSDNKLTDDEKNRFHLSLCKLTYEEARNEYLKNSESGLGKLIAKREVPILDKAKEIINELGIPEEILKRVKNQKYTYNRTGLSESEVRVYDDYVLKTERISKETENEYPVYKWLNKRIPVPEIYEYCIKDNKAFVLMEKAKGKMLCDEYYLNNPEILIKMAAEALRLLWNTDIKGCPDSLSSLDNILKCIGGNKDKICMNDIDRDMLKNIGINTADELIRWLMDNRPEEDVVLSHGDLCLPNIFADNNRISMFIDLGSMGKADRYRDLALILRSIRYNSEGRYTDNKKYFYFDESMLMNELKMELDEDKYRYYLLIDEVLGAMKERAS